ncbi:hypothetical protein PHAMO_190030 [Magnetospirillum molischianum DSM 120]|uniref:Uncharacterized protein n=1 Tax=Magnetospirillum molischianum DSM 120 TaxID=1150626 RepID=H8FPD3_MAGML|nr:hypothetical protein PHAMO_190030 [Magnetospirillum molischianum DSM 120]
MATWASGRCADHRCRQYYPCRRSVRHSGADRAWFGYLYRRNAGLRSGLLGSAWGLCAPRLNEVLLPAAGQTVHLFDGGGRGGTRAASGRRRGRPGGRRWC